jgi:hypothetical protein
VYDYTQEFNNLSQYGGHHVDSDAKKAELYRKGLNIQLQDRLVQNLNLSCNDLASTAIDQEGTMRACAVAKEKKKKKRTMPGPIGGSSSSAPLLAVIKCIYLPPIYVHFIQDIEDRCLLLSSMSFVNLPF